MAVIDVDFDPEDYIEEIETKALKEELKKRCAQESNPLNEPPSHIIADMKRAFEDRNPHEFSYLLRKVENILEAVDD